MDTEWGGQGQWKVVELTDCRCNELEAFLEFFDMWKQAGIWEVAFKSKFEIEIIEGSQLLLKMC